MMWYDADVEGSEGTTFRDMTMLALLGFVAMVILMLPHLNPPRSQAAQDIAAPGNVIVEIVWPSEAYHDIDLWVQAPGDGPVGYSNKGSRVFNLLRDDLGRLGDATGLNYENTYSRGIVPGEYVVNLHFYREEGAGVPVPVKVVVSTKTDPKSSAKQILASDVQLKRQGQELTVFRFTLTEKGELVPGSVNSIPKALRAAAGRPS